MPDTTHPEPDEAIRRRLATALHRMYAHDGEDDGDGWEQEREDWNGPTHLEWLDQADVIAAEVGLGALLCRARPMAECACFVSRNGVMLAEGMRVTLYRAEQPRRVSGRLQRHPDHNRRCMDCRRVLWQVVPDAGRTYLAAGRNLHVQAMPDGTPVLRAVRTPTPPSAAPSMPGVEPAVSVLNPATRDMLAMPVLSPTPTFGDGAE